MKTKTARRNGRTVRVAHASVCLGPCKKTFAECGYLRGHLARKKRAKAKDNVSFQRFLQANGVDLEDGGSPFVLNKAITMVKEYQKQGGSPTHKPGISEDPGLPATVAREVLALTKEKGDVGEGPPKTLKQVEELLKVRREQLRKTKAAIAELQILHDRLVSQQNHPLRRASSFHL